MTVFADYQLQIETAVAAFKALPEAERERLMAEQRRTLGDALTADALRRNGLDEPPPAAPESPLYDHRDPLGVLEPTIELVDELMDDEPGLDTAYKIVRSPDVDSKVAKVMLVLLVRAKAGPLSPYSDVFAEELGQPDPAEIKEGAFAAGASALAICAAHELNPVADTIYAGETPSEWHEDDLGPWEFVDPREALYRAATLIVHQLVHMERTR